jgi:hypothetical protein
MIRLCVNWDGRTTNFLKLSPIWRRYSIKRGDKRPTDKKAFFAIPRNTKAPKTFRFQGLKMVPRVGIEPTTLRFSVACSTN